MGGGEVLRGSCIKARAFEGFVWHRVGEQHHQPVDTNPEPTRRRHTMLKCQQEIFVDALDGGEEGRRGVIRVEPDRSYEARA